MEDLFVLIQKNCKYFNKSEEEGGMYDINDVIDVNHIEIEDNKLILDNVTNDYFNRRKIMELENNKLILKYYEAGNFAELKNKTILAEGIDKFNVQKKGRLIYISFMKGGKLYNKCI